MKIACCMTTIGYSGAPKMMAWVANQLSLAGNEVDLVTYFKNDDVQPVNEKITRCDFNIEHKSGNFIGKAFENIKPAWLLRKRIKKTKPEAILLFSNLTSFIFLKFFKPKNIRVYISERGDPNAGGRIITMLRKSYAKADGIICQTNGAKEALPKEIHDKCIVIPNPVTQKAETRLPLDKRDNFIAFPARFDILQKRQDLMVRAFDIVHKKYPDLRLVFFGDGVDMEKIKDLVSSLELCDFVDFPGRVSPIQDYIRNARLMVLTSDFEGIPNAVIDAMALGLPVVSTDCTPGGARMLIENGVNGILVERGDPQKIADGILCMLDNPDEAERMGENAQKVIEKFDPAKIAGEWCKYIK
ncbi:MAG: glycosyltransferase [Clostridia bacterium]|nr:glycosyltransferase [Clostridia bacterium]